MFLILIAQNLAMGAGPPGVIPPLVVYIDARAVQLVAASSDADPFGVDARAAKLGQ